MSSAPTSSALVELRVLIFCFWDVLMTDPFYKDDDRFTVCTGMFESDMGIGLLTVPVKWHSTKGDYLIKAGTAIAQLIPIKMLAKC